MMRRLHEDFPGYGFATNVGYSTRTHLSMLASQGPCPYHRRSFAPVRLGAAEMLVAAE
jgi:ribonuclease HII